MNLFSVIKSMGRKNLSWPTFAHPYFCMIRYWTFLCRVVRSMIYKSRSRSVPLVLLLQLYSSPPQVSHINSSTMLKVHGFIFYIASKNSCSHLRSFCNFYRILRCFLLLLLRHQPSLLSLLQAMQFPSNLFPLATSYI